MRQTTIAWLSATMIASATGCYEGIEAGTTPFELADDPHSDEPDVDPPGSSNTTCAPTMQRFPVVGPHNIGYDHASCGGPGGCATSCPDVHANSDWNPAATHHGIDVFAHEGADLVAVADGVVTAVGVVSDTSGIRVKIRDACGWTYYYGHLQSATVTKNQPVSIGERIGYMGHTGTESAHLHFNVSPGAYDDDIDPFDLLVATSASACGGAPPPPPPPSDDGADEGGAPPPPLPDPPPPPPADACGLLVPGELLAPDEPLGSCDGRFAVLLQTDGNVALYPVGNNAALWSSGTAGQSGDALVMQEDGNLVLYSTTGAALWHTHTDGHPGSWLAMQDDGNLVLYEGTTALWWSGTAQP